MFIKRFFLLIILVILPLFVLQCGGTKANHDLPHDILGITVGMSKGDAQRHLKEIGKLIREDEKRQEVWVLKENPTFGHLGIGYDNENRVQFVTAFAKPSDGQPMRFDEVGNLATAKKESAGGYNRYIWDVSTGENTGYSVTAQGGNADHLSMLTISKPENGGDEKEEDRSGKK